MKLLAAFLVLMALGLILAAAAGRSADEGAPAGTLLSHDVFFALKDNSPEAQKKLVAACKKYFTGHPGAVSFSAGVREPDLQREVNDRDFDVALHIVFKDRAAHDRYQDSERHKTFIAENRDNWKKVRVFDSVVETADK
jgi:hypothetical protein